VGKCRLVRHPPVRIPPASRPVHLEHDRDQSSVSRAARKTTSSNRAFLSFAAGSKRELISKPLTRRFRSCQARSDCWKINPAPRGA
jgi:hypothetical protein